MQITGGCHCGNLTLSLAWPDDGPGIPARACCCSFCTAHGAVWTSNPDAHLVVRVEDAKLVSAYLFGTETAVFHVCRVCGIVPLASCDIEGLLYAVVNVNALHGLEENSLQRSSSNVEGEEVGARLSRRQRNWIANVEILETPVTRDSK